MTSIRVLFVCHGRAMEVSKIKALGGITWVYRGKCSSKGLR